jgi:hypothetical protein
VVVGEGGLREGVQGEPWREKQGGGGVAGIQEKKAV